MPLSFRNFLVAITLTTLLGCGSGSEATTVTPPPVTTPTTSIDIFGGAVKGPLTQTIVNVYKIDSSKNDHKGALIASAKTNNKTQIENLKIPEPLQPPYLMEMIATADTIDLTTGKAPVISTLRTIITQEMLAAKQNFYATPLTTITLDLAFINADSNTAPYSGDNNNSVTTTELTNALVIAEKQIKSIVGLKNQEDIKFFSTAPLLDNSSTTVDSQILSTKYRASVEAFSAVVFQIQQTLNNEVTGEQIIKDLALDLADGTLDGFTFNDAITSYSTDALTVFQQEPNSLVIPNDSDNRTIEAIKEIIIAETTLTGNNTIDSSALQNQTDISLANLEMSTDTDGDDIYDIEDAFPLDATESVDTDNDTIGNNADTDDDNDGTLDSEDAFPLDETETTDTDNDGVGDNADVFPENANRSSNFSKVNGINDGLIESSQTLVISADNKFMYIGNSRGILAVELDDQSMPTANKTSFNIDPVDGKITHITYVDLSSNGNYLYVAGLTEKNDISTSTLTLFAVDQASGELTYQSTLDNNQTSGITANLAEIFKISPDGKFLYSHNPYGEMGTGLILIYSLDQDNGEPIYVGQYDMGNTPIDYEHNFDISGDGNYIFYGFTHIVEHSAILITLARNTQTGLLTSISTQSLDDVNYANGLSLQTSKTTNELIIAAGGALSIYEIDNSANISLKQHLVFENELSGFMSIHINNDKIAVFSTFTDDTSNNIVNAHISYFTLNENNQYQHVFSSKNLTNTFFQLAITNNGKALHAISHTSDSIYSFNLTSSDHQLKIDKVENNYLENLKIIKTNENNFFGTNQASILGINKQLVNIQLQNDNSLISDNNIINVDDYHSTPLLLNIKDNKFLSLSNNQMTRKLDVSFYQYNSSNHQLPIIANLTLGEGTSLQYRILSALIIENGEYLVTTGRSDDTNFKYSYSLYQIDNTLNKITFLNSIEGAERYFYDPIVFEHNDTVTIGDISSIINIENGTISLSMATDNPQINSSTVFLNDGANAYAILNTGMENQFQIKSYSVNTTNYEFIELESYDLVGNWTLSKLSNDEILAVSPVIDNKITVKVYLAGSNGELTETASTQVNVTSSTDDYTLVKAFQAQDNSNVFWLQIKGGFYEIIKIKAD